MTTKQKNYRYSKPAFRQHELKIRMAALAKFLNVELTKIKGVCVPITEPTPNGDLYTCNNQQYAVVPLTKCNSYTTQRKLGQVTVGETTYFIYRVA